MSASLAGSILKSEHNSPLSCNSFLLCEVCKLGLSGGGRTRCHGVLDHGLNLHRNIPFSNPHKGQGPCASLYVAHARFHS